MTTAGTGTTGGTAPGTAPIRVLLADDQTLVRAAFAMLVESAPDMEVVGQAATGREAVALARSARADLVVMDIRMPDLDGIGATRLIAADEDLAGVRVLVLTTYETDENVIEALRAGASGFLVKDTRPAELLDAIRTVAAGDALLSPGPTARLIARLLRTPAPPGSGVGDPAGAVGRAGLTDRERQVLALVGRGLTNGEIAELLSLSPLTVKTHVSRVMNKLPARDRAQLVIAAYESGLVVPGHGGAGTPGIRRRGRRPGEPGGESGHDPLP
ncbi:response regulator [Streptomyces alkaliphilus]|uniref:response regulator n=1 Tax=Streptomyces alkaliphilus TaxID=1472722 RepID=UPI00117C04A1|nr:response regulator transcription factor [Streptomyces alkaliphilus]MQS07186.1 response regulator [Streptomyces alkaliphilus]